MTINYHGLGATFVNLLRDVIRGAEGTSLRPEDVGDRTITYGWGYTFIRKGRDDIWRVVGTLADDLAAIGTGITLNQDEWDAIRDIAAARNANNLNLAHTLINNFEQSWRYPDLTQDNARVLFNAEIGHQWDYMRNSLRNVLGVTRGDEVYQSLQNTREMIALSSLYYNGPGLFGQKLIRALGDGDRATVWYSIRYGWALGQGNDAQFNNGWAKRRYMESTLFGLYDDPSSVRLEEAVNSYRMLQLNRDRIEQRENQFSNLIGVANSSDYTAVLASFQTTIPTIDEAFESAKYVLYNDLRMREPWLSSININTVRATDIYLDPGRASTLLPLSINHNAILDGRTDSQGNIKTGSEILIGEGGNDTLYGGSGNDILLGGDGNDVLIGGRGSDTLIGGLGDDLYIWNSGDGADYIVEATESDGSKKGRIRINGENINLFAGGTFTRLGTSNVWWDPTHKIVVTHNSPWKVVLEDGSSIQLGMNYEDFQDGDYGIHLQEETVIATTRTIVGDMSPLDSDPDTGGIQYSYDELGNLITTDQPEPDRADTLYDSAVSDHILAGGGSDIIYGDRGGNDIIEAGTGSDIVNAGAGDDLVFGDSQIEVAAAIQRGDTVLGTGVKGDWLVGGLGNDTVVGGDDNDALLGGGGNDLIVGGAGNDVINGGDEYTATSFNWSVTNYGNPFDRAWSPVTIANFDSDIGGNDQIYGGNGNDFIFGHKGDDYLDGGADNDTLVGCDNDDTLLGGAGDDYMTGDYGKLAYDSGSGTVLQGNDAMDGGTGNDWMQGEGGDDYLWGGTGNDTLNGDEAYTDGSQNGADYIDGEEGDDLILGQGGNDVVFGGDGADTILGDDDGIALTLHGVDEMHGGVGNDLMIGGGGDDEIYGDDGDDTLVGGSDLATGIDNGNDYLDGGAGNDNLYGESSDDVLVGDIGRDTLQGDAGLDTLYGDADEDSLFGGDDDDYLDGGSENDMLQTGAGNDVGYGGDGSDVLYGLGGNDTLDGEAGSDELQGGEGADALFGGTDDDALFGENGTDNLDGGDGNDYLDGGSGIDALNGGAGDDLLWGGTEDDILSGDDGVDVLHGEDGNDQLFGGADDDIVYGEAGNDSLDGGTGNDVLQGDSGTDTYIFGRGYGQDDIFNYDGQAYSNGSGILRFNADVRPEDVYANRQGYDLVLAIAGTEDAVTIKNYYLATASTYSSFYNEYTYYYGNQLSQISFSDGTTWSTSTIPLYSAGAADSDYSGGTNYADTFASSTGNDTLSGDAGSDTYLWNIGSGSDVISDNSGTNTILIDAALSPSDVTVSRVGSDTVITLANSPDQIILQGGGNDFKLKFASDGTVWTYADMFMTGTEGHDALWDNYNTNSINGLGGNDTIAAVGGHDTIYGGLGDDTITTSSGYNTVDGGDGNDNITNYNNGYSTISGGSGNDTIQDSAYKDTIIGGTGDDTYLYCNTSSTLVELADEGTDTVQTSVSFTLGANFENLTLTGSYGLNGTGNDANNTLVGTNYNDQLLGLAGDDTLNGAGGVDTLNGGVGNDTYLFGRGSGQDTITGETDSTGATDTVVIAVDVQSSQVQVSRDVNDLVLSISGTTDTLRVSGYYSATASIEQIQFLSDATIWDAAAIASQLQSLPSAGDDLLLGTTSNDVINSLAGNDTVFGYAGDDSLDGGAGNDSLVGGTGNDTYVVDATTDVIVENANEGLDTIQSAVSYTLASNVENLTLTDYATINGTGNSLDNILVGNRYGNSLIGNEGNDTLDGAAGTDTMSGGLGNDTYYMDTTSDVIAENAGAGTDTVVTTFSYTLATNFENLTFTGTSALTGTGNSVANVLTGNSGNNVLDGGSGADTMEGSLGDDTYIVDNVADNIVENIGEGIDNVQSSVSYTLSSNVENITLTGKSAINATGNNLNNIFAGNSGNNVFAGWAGDDMYIITSGDTIVENPDEGIDTVQTSSAYTLAANIENVILTGTSRISATGNTLNNMITGNTANNSLTGGAGDDTLIGGGGTDTLVGGTGNDHYIYNNTSYVITENANEGIDTVESSFTYTLGANLEKLVLASNLLINGTGNAANNVITGNDRDNVLNGAAGTDTMIGGGGYDTYIVDDTSDVIVENANQGTDIVQSSASYALSSNIENLTLTGTSAINGTGNDLSNTLTGNSAANILAGGAGDDVYIVDGSDEVIESANEGIDNVQSSATFALGANVENLTLTGTAAINGTGNDSDNLLNGNSGVNVLSGGAGNDIYIVAAGDAVIENANEGIDTVNSSVAYTLAANVENLSLTGTSAINGTGNDIGNILTGNDGANVLSGGAGDDTYIVGSGDTVIENVNEGIDTVQASASFTLGTDVENLILTGVTTINGTGNALDNIIIGNTGNNVLDGGFGNDQLIGGLGDDTYIIDSQGDVVIENAGEGADTVQTYFSFSSRGNIENVTLLGTAAVDATGDAGNNVLTGNSAVNTLMGGIGNDTLTGGGDIDTLIGGLGDDTYTYSADVVIVENASEGTDTLLSDTSLALDANFANIENLTLTGTAAINGVGDNNSNVITGNAADNYLDGGDGFDSISGGYGNDTLVGSSGDTLNGGAGDDTYIVTNGYNALNDSGGIDTIQSNITVRLYTDVWNDNYGTHVVGFIENATLTGNASIDAYGYDGNNTLIGNDGDNRLYGEGGDDLLAGGGGYDYLDGDSGNNTLIGGIGNDTLIGYVSSNLSDQNALYGGLGDDTYYINDLSRCTLTEYAGEGIDTISYSGGDYTLSANFENLSMGSGTGTGNAGNNRITASSNWQDANTLYGFGGDDTLDGGGSVDTLIGGTGNDTYIVDNVNDVITEKTNEGIDTVNSSVNYTLSAYVENLTLTGTYAINAAGNNLNNVLTGNSVNNILTGGLGDDTYVITSGDTVVENTNEGTDTIVTSFSYTLGASSNIENLSLTGTSGLSATGNTLNNVLAGNSGDNVLDGGAGLDTMMGGFGNDTYVVDNTVDMVTENADEGTDAVQSSVTYSISAFANVENLTLTGTAAIDGTGNTDDNILTGNSAANVLIGGLGNDTYVVSDTLDTLIENVDEGLDTVQSSVTYTLDANIENLVLIGATAINGAGNSLNNVLTGNSASNILTGGLGDDTYVVTSGDTVVENIGEGVDTILSSTNYTLGANIENLVITGSASNATGNTLDNALTGNSYSNTINGGIGSDTMLGGAGADTYIVDNITDVVVENASDGTDTVQSSISYTLANADNVENLTLTGTQVIDASGNTLDNILTGNSASNVLTGGMGNDTYVIGAGDTVIENDAEGVDTVQSSLTYTLGSYVENLTLTGTALNGTGNMLHNLLVGNTYNNLLTGYEGDDTLDGGTGSDTLIGGTGNDTYFVNVTTDVITENYGEGVDTVTSSITYTLGAELENLTLTGSSVINGTGNELNNILTGNSAGNVLTGGLGDDTYVIGTGDVVVESVNEGTDTAQSTVSHTLSANIENLTLTGTQTISGAGNSLDNVLLGNIAANWLDGQSGTDTMAGGLGDDTYYVDVSGDVVIEAVDEGIDTVQSSISYVLGNDLENLLLSGVAADGTGNVLNNVLTGNAADNVLTGLAGDDTLDGNLGADTLIGGAGNDTYYLDSLDTVVENAGEGVDSVESYANWYALGDNLENLTLGGFAVWGIGNTLNNVIVGSRADNILDGGAGADTMSGGYGDDTYYVDSLGDAISESNYQGTDTVVSSVSFTLGSNLENLMLTGTSDIIGIGNSSNNNLFGNDAANMLDGGTGNDWLDGGAGADTMIGGDGADTYIVDDVGDVVQETITTAYNGTTDIVLSSLDYTLGANVENLTLTGTNAINAFGNELNNTLIGNYAANVLSGGSGDDWMAGGLGDDTYVVDSTGDWVGEYAGEGTDTVESYISYSLGVNLENLVLTGSTAINGTGNKLGNLMAGNSAANLMNGAEGNDIVQSGAGNDTLLADTGNNLLDGGADTDTLVGGVGNELFISGAGNDIIDTSTGTDILVFNRGSGLDTVISSSGTDNTLSLGGGITLGDLVFRKEDNNLILDTGTSDSVILENWYADVANHSVLTLQIIEEAAADFSPTGGDPLRDNQIEYFDFIGLANTFDLAIAANPGLTSWSLTQALTDFHLGGSDTEALGGDLAYQYGKDGTLASVGLTAAQSILAESTFGSSAQTLQPVSTLQEGTVRLV